MKNYTNFDRYYDELLGDVYPQLMDKGHLKNMTEIINTWVYPLEVDSVLDVGCGFGDARSIFEHFVYHYKGISLAENDNSFEQDFNFLGGNKYDLIFSRHTLEHSPFPLITLMEWYRVSKKWLCLVLPNPKHYTFVGRNHYSVMDASQAAWILRRAGWKINRVSVRTDELWFLCAKKRRIGYEGWARIPVPNCIYEFERSLKYCYGEADIPNCYDDLPPEKKHME